MLSVFDLSKEDENVPMYKEEGLRYLPYKFTAKEQDEETGLYYYEARYLDAKYSRWLSTDPALGDYIPRAPISDEARKHNRNLPGMGGVFNHINGNLYHYAANNPVRYIDPDGRFQFKVQAKYTMQDLNWGMNDEKDYSGVFYLCIVFIVRKV